MSCEDDVDAEWAGIRKGMYLTFKIGLNGLCECSRSPPNPTTIWSVTEIHGFKCLTNLFHIHKVSGLILGPEVGYSELISWGFITRVRTLS
jgi:hypothetical protein